MSAQMAILQNQIQQGLHREADLSRTIELHSIQGTQYDAVANLYKAQKAELAALKMVSLLPECSTLHAKPSN